MPESTTTAPAQASCGAVSARRFREVRRFTEALAAPLGPEDCVVQSMPDVSPTRWHLAHTTWFFETFVLARAVRDYRPYQPAYSRLFNSYYNLVGEQFPRARRGVLSRPTVAEVFAYRQHVDAQVAELIDRLDAECNADLLTFIEVGLHHEHQHQELILTDIKHVLSCNPLYPAYHEQPPARATAAPDLAWISHEEDVRWIGHDGGGFAYDNESPRHRVFVDAFELATRLTTNAEYLAFLDDGGYRRPALWLSDGWNQVQTQGWSAPLYWVMQGDSWHEFTLAGLRPLDPAAPVCHVSYYEADAFARWAGARLATEAEWEVAAESAPVAGNFVESGHLHPHVADGGRPATTQLFGDVWEWTASPYTAYPGFTAPAGALGEYNGKFMCNQLVLRGGSCATAQAHLRPTYRNFFPPDARWQFTGIRLARG